MKTRILIVIAILVISNKLLAQCIFVGPMIHWNLGIDKNRHVGFGIEASYWCKKDPFGIDLGFEFAKEKFRLYSELEAGRFLGLSCGAVGEFSKNDKFRAGFQGSIWAACFQGFNMRVRRFDTENEWSPGIFVKLPVLFKPEINLDLYSGGGNIMPM